MAKLTRLQGCALHLIMELAEQNMLSERVAQDNNQMDEYDEQQWAMKQVRKLWEQRED